MEDERDLLDLLAIDVTQLGCIDELMKNTATDNNIEKQVVELGFEADIQEDHYSHSHDILEQQSVMNSDVGLDVATVDTAISIPANGVRDNLISDTILFAPTKMKKKPCRWTKEEHGQMKRAFRNGLMGQWKKISRLYIPTKTPAQVTSHAQKYLLRRNNRHNKRKSIFDDGDTDDNDMSYEVHNEQQPSLLIPPTTRHGTHDVNNTVYHQQEVVHDPSSSAMSSIVNYQTQSPLQLQSPTTPPPMTPPTRMHDDIMKMPPAAHDDAAALYYANQYLLLLEEQKKLMMMMMLNSRHDMTTAPVNGLLPGAGYSSNGSSFGVDQLEPYNNVGSSSSVDQWVLQPEPLVQQFGRDHHVVLPPHDLHAARARSGPPTNRGY